MNAELVIARYKEPNLGWVLNLSRTEKVKTKVWEKGPIPSSRGEFERGEFEFSSLPNVGREAHTWCHHVVSRWDSLAEYTFFCQADPCDHFRCGLSFSPAFAELHPDLVTCGRMVMQHVKAARSFSVPSWVRCREWTNDGVLNAFTVSPWKERWANGEIAPARLTFAEYALKHLNLDLKVDCPNGLGYSPGACFGVRRELIRRRPLKSWEALLETVSGHVHPLEAHYLERLWPAIFLGAPA